MCCACGACSARMCGVLGCRHLAGLARLSTQATKIQGQWRRRSQPPPSSSQAAVDEVHALISRNDLDAAEARLLAVETAVETAAKAAGASAAGGEAADTEIQSAEPRAAARPRAEPGAGGCGCAARPQHSSLNPGRQ